MKGFKDKPIFKIEQNNIDLTSDGNLDIVNTDINEFSHLPFYKIVLLHLSILL